jgi:hypothetical protein
MKPPKKTKPIQAELFCEQKFISLPISLEVPLDRQEELKKTIGELLLNLALEEVKRDA